MTKLAHATPRLRMEVARAITRKRAPELTFIPATPGEVWP
jgi:ribosome-binding factor A